MDDTLTRIWADIVGRLHGPLTFRLILQPIMAALYAFRDGIKDAQLGRPAYLWSIFTKHDAAVRMLREGLHSVARVIGLGVVMDIIYQVAVFRWIYPTELLIVVLLLAFVPYLILRGPINRIARYWVGKVRVP